MTPDSPVAENAHSPLRGPRFPAPSPSAVRAASDPDTDLSPKWLFAFAILLMAGQVGLVLFGNTPLRTPLRVAAYGLGLGLCLVLHKRTKSRHPATRAAIFVVGILMVNLLQMPRSTTLASVAQLVIYIAVLSPLYWAAGIRLDQRHFRLLLLLLWTFQAASAATAVLQVEYPGRFRGAISSIIMEDENVRQGALRITLADGTRMLRPTGLTDTPGGAAFGGLYSIVFGLGLFFTERRLLVRALLLGGMIAGVFCVLMCQQRTFVVMAIVCAVGFGSAVAGRRDWGRFFQVPVLVAVIVVVGAGWALSVGGEDLMNRLSTLTEDDPGSVFYKNRGTFLEQTFKRDIPDYPFGAGMGRWGMMGSYFGNPAKSLYAEVMWTSWVYDGGVPLMIAYMAAVGIAIYAAWKIATVSPLGNVSTWAAMVFSYNLAALAATFVFPIFSLQTGMEFWFLNACFWLLWRNESLRARPPKRRAAVRDLRGPTDAPAMNAPI